MSTIAPLGERFWAKVDRSGDCWIWSAGRFRSGYGQFKVGQTQRRAHRVAWELTHGPIPAGLCVLHSCDTPPCVNPAHLRLGDQADNAADREARHRNGAYTRPDRFASGARDTASKLTPGQVVEMRKMITAGVGASEAGRRFGVTAGTARAVARLRTWRLVEATS
jgi:hypothetical protein